MFVLGGVDQHSSAFITIWPRPVWFTYVPTRWDEYHHGFHHQGKINNLTLLKFNNSPLKSDRALTGKLPSIIFQGRSVIPWSGTFSKSKDFSTSWAQISTSYKWSSCFFTPISRLQISPHLQPHLLSVIYTGTISAYIYQGNPSCPPQSYPPQ